jgi:predicted  nucleic acid-binding Zn-ribbon protein
MANLQEVRDDLADVSHTVDSIATGLDTVATQIQDLKDAVAAGGVITQDELDALSVTVQDIKARALAALSKEQGL